MCVMNECAGHHAGLIYPLYDYERTSHYDVLSLRAKGRGAGGGGRGRWQLLALAQLPASLHRAGVACGRPAHLLPAEPLEDVLLRGDIHLGHDSGQLEA